MLDTPDDKMVDHIERRHSAALLGIVNTVDWLLVALLLTLIFRAFVMEAFRIPTGSMAETLRGAHYHLRCTQCGFKYDLGYDGSTPQPRCPVCRYYMPTGIANKVSNGDRILVLKSIYQFTDPARWDVVVFKSPVNPEENYIKRTLALPYETIELIDGDVYIDGSIKRKPPRLQDELWMCIYDNDYQPFDPGEKPEADSTQPQNNDIFTWAQPFSNTAGSKWNLNANGPTVFSLDSPPKQTHTIAYDSQNGKNFRATYAYNNSRGYRSAPICSDLMTRFIATPRSAEGSTGITLKKYETFYRGWVDFAGRMIIEKTNGSETTKLATREINPPKTGRPVTLRFANVDHMLVLEFDHIKLKAELGSGTGSLDIDKTGPPEVKIFGSGKLDMTHIGIYRDIHYINTNIRRPRKGESFTLRKNEFFMCGDNSPASSDSRLWPTEGIGDNGKTYRTGIVPRDYLMGKAFFLYWGDAFKPFEDLLPVIPNLSRLKFIYGNSDEKL